ncbi:hypothetical protein JCM8097_003270 [Rhodosporidiobolus ruineniae]
MANSVERSSLDSTRSTAPVSKPLSTPSQVRQLLSLRTSRDPAVFYLSPSELSDIEALVADFPSLHPTYELIDAGERVRLIVDGPTLLYQFLASEFSGYVQEALEAAGVGTKLYGTSEDEGRLVREVEPVVALSYADDGQPPSPPSYRPDAAWYRKGDVAGGQLLEWYIDLQFSYTSSSSPSLTLTFHTGDPSPPFYRQVGPPHLITTDNAQDWSIPDEVVESARSGGEDGKIEPLSISGEDLLLLAVYARDMVENERN